MAKKRPKKKKPKRKKLGERHVAVMRGARSYVETTLFDPKNDTGLVDGGLRLQSLTGASELQVLYSNGSPLLHEIFK